MANIVICKKKIFNNGKIESKNGAISFLIEKVHKKVEKNVKMRKRQPTSYVVQIPPKKSET